MYSAKIASTPEEIKRIITLRINILRKPWNQDPTTATDLAESKSINAYIENENREVIACGRLQENENNVGQIRFMAVSDKYQGKGLGKIIVKALEEKAKTIGLKSIELQARENAVDFYKNCGYSIREKSFLLWDIIQHYLMDKKL